MKATDLYLNMKYHLPLTICCLLFLSVLEHGAAQKDHTFQRAATKLMRGAIDMHIHSAPDNVPRSLTDDDVVAQAQKRKMSAVVIKSHIEPTASRAILQNSRNPKIICFGGIALNTQVGGFNPAAVQAMIDMKPSYGKVVWMPTRDAEFSKKNGGGLSIFLDENLRPQVLEILQLIAANNLVLATGHLSPAEIMKLVKTAHNMGINKIIITHGHAEIPGLNPAQLKDLSKWGAKIELTFLNSAMDANDSTTNKPAALIPEVINLIRDIGAEHFIITSDLGQALNPKPVDGLQSFIQLLLQGGLSESEIKIMVQDNPAKLLDIR